MIHKQKNTVQFSDNRLIFLGGFSSESPHENVIVPKVEAKKLESGQMLKINLKI